MTYLQGPTWYKSNIKNWRGTKGASTNYARKKLQEEKERIEKELTKLTPTDEVIPSKKLLKTIAKEQENEAKGMVSPVFSSVAEMKKWHEEH